MHVILGIILKVGSECLLRSNAINFIPVRVHL